MTVHKQLDQLKYRLNLIIIALLCSTTLAPSLIFYVRGEGKFVWMILFIGISYLISRIPKEFYHKLHLSTDLKVYKKLGVDKFKKFSTNGDFINKGIRKQYPTYSNINNIKTVREKLNETYVIERSHTVLFVFCLLTNIYALWTNSYITAIVLFVGNIMFNFYPNLLQQYNRIRYLRLINNYS